MVKEGNKVGVAVGMQLNREKQDSKCASNAGRVKFSKRVNHSSTVQHLR